MSISRITRFELTRVFLVLPSMLSVKIGNGNYLKSRGKTTTVDATTSFEVVTGNVKGRLLQRFENVRKL